MVAGQQLDDDPILAVAASRQDKARIAPLHQAS
jgi:hypothetical protein